MSRIVPQNDKEIFYEPDDLSQYSLPSGTHSYRSIKRPNHRCVHKRVQEEPPKFYKLKMVEDDVPLAMEPLKPFVLDSVALEQIAAQDRKKKSQKMKIKKVYQDEAYKKTAFRLMDEYFSHSTGQIFRLSGSTEECRLSLQMCSVDRIRQKSGGKLDEAMIDKEFAQETPIDEEKLRKARILALKKGAR